MNWEKHVSELLCKTSQRLYFLRQLKRSGLSSPDLITYFVTIIRPVLEFACPVWHPGLTQEQTYNIERCQKRAMTIIAPDISYEDALDEFKLPSLESRRIEACRKLFNDIRSEQHKLNNLLPAIRRPTYGLRNQRRYSVPNIRNKRITSDFITYSLLRQ